MATDVLATDLATRLDLPSDARPYAPSWADRFIDWLTALPGPEWAAWATFAAVALVWTTVGGWAAGDVPFGQIAFVQSSYAFFLVFPFLLLRILDRAATRSLQAFAPALPADADLARIRYELTTAPAGPAIVLAVVGSVLDGLSWLTDPVTSGVHGPAVWIAMRAVGEFTIVAVWFVVMYQTLRQMRFVSRLHAQARNIDLFQPAPLYAFSHLTARVGIAFVIVSGLTLLTSTVEQLQQPFTFSFLAAFMVLGVAAFTVPLLGLHGRLVAEKGGLVAAANDRLKVTIARLHATVDTADMSAADQIQKTLTGLMQEREILAHLRTWPWDPTTFRAFASAIALPIALWLATRLLERVV